MPGIKGSRFVLTVIVSDRTALWHNGNRRLVYRHFFTPDVQQACKQDNFCNLVLVGGRYGD